jgi:hypothetical protein
MLDASIARDNPPAKVIGPEISLDMVAQQVLVHLHKLFPLLSQHFCLPSSVCSLPSHGNSKCWTLQLRAIIASTYSCAEGGAHGYKRSYLKPRRRGFAGDNMLRCLLLAWIYGFTWHARIQVASFLCPDLCFGYVTHSFILSLHVGIQDISRTRSAFLWDLLRMKFWKKFMGFRSLLFSDAGNKDHSS